MKKLIVTIVSIIAIIGVWIFITGLIPRTDVFIHEYSVMPSGEVMTIKIGIGSSMGYARSYSDISDDPHKMILQFHSAFGGLNSRMGAQNVFLLPLNEECTQIYVYGHDWEGPVLQKNEATGEWGRVE